MLIAQAPIIKLAVLLFVVVLLIVVFAIISHIFILWFPAFMTGVRVGVSQIIGMTFRKVDPKVVVRTLIMTKQAGIELSCDEVERAYLQGADINKITMALIRAKREGTEMSFQELVEADLAGSTGGG